MAELDTQIKLLDFCEKKIPRRISRNLYLNRLFSANASFVLGCQRSGTTLLFLMLSSHPNITGLDENYSKNKYPHWPVLFANAFKRKKTLYKLPEQVWSVDYICNQFPKAKIIWIIRNPYAVISSMKSLMFGPINWIEKTGRRELLQNAKRFPELDKRNIASMTNVQVGAYLWKCKNQLIQDSQKKGLETISIQYEKLVKSPQTQLEPVMNFLKLPWSPELLEYSSHHQGEEHPGGISTDKPIDASRERPRLCLTPQEIQSITEIVGSQLPTFGYEFDAPTPQSC